MRIIGIVLLSLASGGSLAATALGLLDTRTGIYITTIAIGSLLVSISIDK